MKKKTTSLAETTANVQLEVYLKGGKALRTVMTTVATLLFAVFAAINTNAATFTVTSAADSGAGTLRQAVLDANAAAGADTIMFGGGTFFIGLQTELPMTSDITIDGKTAAYLVVSGTFTSRIFNVTGGNLTINSVTMFAGRAPMNQEGGCIQTATPGTVTINESAMWACGATGGGAIRLVGGNLVIRNTTIASNSASADGGAIVVNSSTSTLTLISSTVANNFANTTGGGIRVLTGNVTARNSIIADNTAPTHPDISANVNSQGYNLIENTSGASISGVVNGNITGVDPQLASLTETGPGMYSMLPNRTSPVIDAGDANLQNTTDQRRARRNTDGNLNGVAGVDIGAVERQRTAFDSDNEDTADALVTRTAMPNIVWYSGYQASNSFVENFSITPNAVSQFTFGLPTDVLVPADYDGDGKMDQAVYRRTDGNWYINGSSVGLRIFAWGLANDTPVPADYDGDGKADIAQYRNGVWYVFGSQAGYTGAVALGSANDKPVPADYDGDLKADLAIFNAGVWTINRSTAGPTIVNFGIAGDTPVPADYNGDGIDNLAVFRSTSGTWYIQRTVGYDAVPFGLATDKVVPADYDGDGTADIAVWRSNTNTGKGDWYVLRSRDGYILNSFGFSTDTPVANALIR